MYGSKEPIFKNIFLTKKTRDFKPNIRSSDQPIPRYGLKWDVKDTVRSKSLSQWVASLPAPFIPKAGFYAGLSDSCLFPLNVFLHPCPHYYV